MRELNFWGWGWADKFPDRDARKSLGEQAGAMLGFTPERLDEPPGLADIEVPQVSLPDPPASLASCVTASPEARIRHTYGRSYADILSGFRGDFSRCPDRVATPQTETEVADLLSWADDANLAVIPYGGGTSVVRGVEAAKHSSHAGTLTIDLRALNRVLEVEHSSHSARIQAGATGPLLEQQLSEHGLTLRHFPQSFEFSTLGGWIATRAGGHFATVYTHIDDLVQSTRALTPSGVLESRRLPGSGAGPSPDRVMLGSEGTLGILTEAWMRVRPRPVYRAQATCHFDTLGQAVEAVRAISQSGLYPSNCRLLDRREAALNMVAFDGSTVVLLGFESADHPLEPWMGRALELVADHGGRCPKGATYRESGERAGHAGGAGQWRASFIDAPYLMNTMASLGVIVDTFETAIPWDQFEAFHAQIIQRVRAVLKDQCGQGFLSMRFTHVYPDGPAPYYTFIAPGRYGHELEQWNAIKAEAMAAVVEGGGTVTHHHAVGRTHLPGYQQQRPELFAQGMRAFKSAVDPNHRLNPGVLWP